MAVSTLSNYTGRSWLTGALTVTRREIRDTLRDWRIVAPIVILTLFFPVLMNFTVGAIRSFLLTYGGQNVIISDRLVPFFLMIVGFFPISFSLVVALETFVGERERKSIEALLCTPLTNGQLYLGKMLAAMLPPLGAAYLGIVVYLVGLYVFRGWSTSPLLLLQIVLLTTCEAVVMVSGAVVISSQTTSTRAANLLASFIIVPMALVVQAESFIMFQGNYSLLWAFIAALVVVDLLLARMGLHLFDREQLLGREFDTLNFKDRARKFLRFFRRVDPKGPEERFTLLRVYRRDLPSILRRARLAGWTVLAATAVGLAGGWLFGRLESGGEGLSGGSLSAIDFQFIFWNNLRVVLISSLIGVFTFGVIPTVVPLANSALIAFVLSRAAGMGHDPLALLAAGILPHGVFEMTAVWLGSITALRLGAVVVTRQPQMTLGESWLSALADFVKVFMFVVAPLLIVAALVEANITPAVLTTVLGR